MHPLQLHFHFEITSPLIYLHFLNNFLHFFRTSDTTSQTGKLEREKSRETTEMRLLDGLEGGRQFLLLESLQVFCILLCQRAYRICPELWLTS